LKVRYALSNALGGVMFWSVDADTDRGLLVTVIESLIHPFRMRACFGADSPQGVELSWHGLTGQTYSVDCATNLVEGAWTGSLTLVSTSNVQTNDILGLNQRITVVDTNAFNSGRSFYKTLMTGPDPGP